MTAYILRRLLWAVFTVYCVFTVVFVLVYSVGNPAQTTLGPNASAEQIADFERREGLDQPVWRQYTSRLGTSPCVRRASPEYAREGYCGALQLDFGTSYRGNEAVSAILAQRLPRTLLLGGMALIFELLIGITFGILAAVKRNTWFDTGFMGVAFLGISLPTYVTGPLFLWLFAFLYGWFPVGGYGVDAWDHVYHAILPALTLAIVGAATYARIMRSEMVDTLRSDYLRTARAKGLPGWRVVLVHAARNALLPIVTLMGLSMTILVSGAIITESIFAWPGMGNLAILSVVQEDAPIIIGVVLVFAVTVQVGNLLADIALAALDPRLRIH